MRLQRWQQAVVLSLYCMAFSGDYDQLVGTINNMVGAISGMVCDGAKGGCAYKLSTAASEAVIQAYLQ